MVRCGISSDAKEPLTPALSPEGARVIVCSSPQGESIEVRGDYDAGR